LDEQQKKVILERRTANQKLSQLIQEGMHYHECLKMKLIDGQEHDVQVYALSENEFRTLLEEFGVELKDFGNKEKMTENMKMVEQLAQVATGQEDIAKLVLANGCMEIMLKCFEISGLSPSKEKNVESFQPRDLQP
jgi:uncharacterized protein with PhoU and TrkA domain